MATAEESAELLQELLEEIVDALGLEARVEVRNEGGDALTGVVHGEDLGLFIGRHGQTIDAIQHLAQRVVLADYAGRGPRVTVDAEGYRLRREEALHRQADQAADDAVRAGRPVRLDAMTAAERRLVHEHLRERGDVETHSEGEEPHRHLVVTPAGG
jgi:spoIIIJ-associated protein